MLNSYTISLITERIVTKNGRIPSCYRKQKNMCTYFFSFVSLTVHLSITLANDQLDAQILNPLNPELNPICYLLALLGAHHFLHVSRIRVKLITFRRLMSYIYMEHPFLMFLDHTQRRSTVGRTPLDE